MTTAAGLPAVRESLSLALRMDPDGSRTVVDATEAAVEFYALGYSKHPPAVLFDEIHRTRRLLAQALAPGRTAEPVAVDLRRGIGWLSALLGNAAHHLDDHTGARVHLTAAVAFGERTGDARLAAWACGALSMVARATDHHTAALTHAERGLALAPRGLPSAQLHAWAELPSLAALGQAQDADRALADAARALEVDAAEHQLHQAEAFRVLGRTDKAVTAAEGSLNACVPRTPGWAAASLALAQAEAPILPGDAAARALDVLDRVPAARLRSTTRSRLKQLDAALAASTADGVTDLHERVHALRPVINTHGTAQSA
ncbi:Twin-arginine translocation pathway signal [Streptomyces roseirectus]|uniref:Twin-arginine translocation pathway signal n=1 Tax=Streptomyces roseirectus TaxID=2768066 RepID=A0A7H0IQ92_9ACTN|nr:Twin-arginine translocation pathway signal [Streptomyces roseirectus]QNP74958.1 Twin-arginine translocation pathway signal [Streptomyces roseirectus]